MLLRRTCSSKPIGLFCGSKAAYTTYRPKSFTPNDSQNVPCHETLTLLHRMIKLLPRALPSTAQGNLSSFMESFEFWNAIMARACENLTLAGGRPARIAVCGFGEFSGTQDLVTALLEEPLSSDQNQNEHIRNRWKDRVGRRSLIITNSPSSQPSTIVTRSAYLHQFHMPVEITETLSITHPTPNESPSTRVIDECAAQDLLQADAAIIVCNPLTTPLSTLLETPLFTRNPNSILILSFTSLSYSELRSQPLSRFTYPMIPREPAIQGREIHFVDPVRALSAIRTLTSNPHTPNIIEKFQDEYMSSNISNLTTSLKSLLSPSGNLSGGSLQKRTALAQLRGALHTCNLSLTKARGEMEEVSMAVGKLIGRMEEATAKARGEVLGQSDQANPSRVGDIVGVALKAAKQEMKQVMDRLTWWRMFLRVDEISTTVSQTLQRSWCQNLEKHLIMQTGQLSSLQSDITTATSLLLSRQATPSFKSAVLENTLNQLKTSQDYHLTPETLTSPIFSRSAQIVKYPTMSLHIAGQRIVLGMAGGMVSSVGLGWAGWVGWLVGNGEGLLTLTGVDAGTAVGVGLLGAATVIRWAAGAWERSKRQWWEDCNRVSDGLHRDLIVRVSVFIHG
ncbi:hypothetical protein BDZ94DRAFT_1171027 [Collybia nuda]|uniref:Mmc1 C-terminal domain-containing protein n=1 Tax=Collybia nuda TaxID=64659 RepID=A0A9P5XZA1_9AGAR|nr:hypothetical protein BDZ94DRAFT_1171027 [Collybia nuda]